MSSVMVQTVLSVWSSTAHCGMMQKLLLMHQGCVHDCSEACYLLTFTVLIKHTLSLFYLIETGSAVSVGCTI
jgi:hypothetical protein